MAIVLLAVILGGVAGPAAHADVVFRLDLPLISEVDTQAVVSTYGGQILGGQFGADGWTTTDRDDFIMIDLPYQLDTREGQLQVTIKSFELDFPFTGHFWHFVLAGIDGYGAPTLLVPTGRAHLSSGHRGYWDAGADNVAIAYWNLFDASCSDWHNCTTEVGSGANFVDEVTPVTWTHQWQAQTQWVTFSGPATVNRTMDLSATSPGGEFYEDQLYLTINLCGGGSNALLCGSWDEPGNRGGPLGVTYSDVVLEIYGDLPPDGGVVPPDGAPPDGSASWDARPGPEAGPQVDAAPPADAAPPGDAASPADAAPEDPDSYGGGCACDSAGAGLPGPLLALLALALPGLGRRRRRRHPSSPDDMVLAAKPSEHRIRSGPRPGVG